MSTRITLAAVLILLTLAAPARAASPVITLSSDQNASHPGVAVADDGTAHVAWVVSNPGGAKLVYCRLPRGASACDKTQTFDPADGSIAFDTTVLLPEPGKVQLLIQRCCYPADRLSVITSTDNGQTFAAPQLIGDAESDQAISGPGPTAITVFRGGSPNGIAVQVATTDGPPTTNKAFLKGDCVSCYYPGGIGLINSTTPIVAYTDLQDTYLRTYDATKGTAYNVEANWLAPVKLPGENDPHLLTSAGVTYLMTAVVGQGTSAYVMRRVSALDGSLTAPVPAADYNTAIFTTIAGDSGGGLTTIWTQSGGDQPIRTAVKAPGSETFARAGNLVDVTNAFNIKAATAPDRGGLVVWDANSLGTISAAAIPVGGAPSDPPPPDAPPPPPTTPADLLNDAGCTRKVPVRTGVTAIVLTGCWTKKSATVWTTTNDVDLNGITFTTDGSSAITVDTAKHTLHASKGVKQSAGSIVLAREDVTWDLDGTTKFTDVQKSKIKLFDFLVTGETLVTFQPNAATISTNLQLPDPFDLVTGQTVLKTTTKGGLDLKGVTIKVPNATIGVFGFKNLSITFTGGLSTFVGHVDFLLPPDGDELNADIGFDGGKLNFLRLGYAGTPLPFAIFSGLWLKKVDLEYDGRDGFLVGGGGEFGIPAPGGPITIDALTSSGNGFTFAIPKGKSYADMTLSAALKLFGLKIGGGNAHFRTTGEFDFGVNLSLGFPKTLGLFGDVSGDVNLPQGTFSVEGHVDACVVFCAGFDAIASSVGVAACPDISFGVDPFSFTLQFLVGYKWSGSLQVQGGCNLGPYKPAKPGPPSTGDPVKLVSSGLIDVGFNDPTKGEKLRTISLDVKGSGGVPGITVEREGGAPLVASDPSDLTKPVEGDHIILAPSPGTDSVNLVILQTNAADQIAGPIRIKQNGGAPIAFRVADQAADGRAVASQTVSGISVAKAYADTKVTAKIGGKGRKRTITYAASNLGASGRTVEFREDGAAGITKVIGASKKARGTLRWTIFDGAKGKRKVLAIVRNADGLPISSKTVASYVAPGPVLPSRPTKLRLKRDAKSRLKISWKGTSGATQRLIVVTVADGRILRILTTKHSVTIPGVAKKEKVRVTVRGRTKNGRQGPSASARR